MNKLVKTRKEHLCDFCGGVINKGDFAVFSSRRYGKFNKEDKQIGIEYWKSYTHNDTKECIKNGSEIDFIIEEDDSTRANCTDANW